jgi:archaetidylinositol phosphate synthase
MAEVEKHDRANDLLLGPLERPALQWLCIRMPARVTSDILTVVGACGAILTFFSYWLSNYEKNFLWLASLGYVINWFGDSLDGTLARYRKNERPRYGFFVDHSVDAFSQVLFFAGIGLSPYVRLDIALLALTGYLLMSTLAYVGAFVSGEFRISYAKMSPTEMRLLAIIVNTLFFFVKNPDLKTPWGPISVFNIIVLTIAVVLMVAFIVTMTSRALLWRKEDAPEKDRQG